MVDLALMETVMRLDESARLELRDAIDNSLGNFAAESTVTLLKERLAEADENPNDYTTLDQLKRQLQDGPSA
jgi:hypothetical protein